MTVKDDLHHLGNELNEDAAREAPIDEEPETDEERQLVQEAPMAQGILYVCGECGAGGIKLWRRYQELLSHRQLLCAVHAGGRSARRCGRHRWRGTLLGA